MDILSNYSICDNWENDYENCPEDITIKAEEEMNEGDKRTDYTKK